ncbi:trypsin-like serine peptidase [Nocardiopsis coralliicola]
MTSSLVRAAIAPLAAAAIAASAAGAAAESPPPQPTEPRQETVRHTASETPEDVLAYWTGARMAAAEPIERVLGGVLAPPGQDGAPEAPQDGAAPEGAAGASPEPRPDTHSQAAAGDTAGSRWSGGGKVARTTGRVFLSMDGRDFTCSASTVPAGNRATVVTAGHCLKDGTGAWASNWVFVPGYRDGEAPHGKFAAREMLVTPEWSGKGDDSHDFGAAVLEPNGAGEQVREAVGAQRIAFSGEGAASVHAFGYPSRPPYDGTALYYCAGPTTADDGGTTARGMDCDMTEGSSGGPWFSGFDAGEGTGTLVSVVSFKYADKDGVQYGPVLGASEKGVYEDAAAL